VLLAGGGRIGSGTARALTGDRNDPTFLVGLLDRGPYIHGVVRGIRTSKARRGPPGIINAGERLTTYAGSASTKEPRTTPP
jgi:hypothetical protein